MERIGNGEAFHKKKPSGDSLAKDQLESVISAQSISCAQIFVSEGWFRSFLMKVVLKADKWKREGLGQE